MRSSVKRALLIAAIAGSAIAPTAAIADHNVSPGQTCKSAQVADDPATAANEFQEGRAPGETQGQCASRVAKGNGHGGGTTTS